MPAVVDNTVPRWYLRFRERKYCRRGLDELFALRSFLLGKKGKYKMSNYRNPHPHPHRILDLRVPPLISLRCGLWKRVEERLDGGVLVDGGLWLCVYLQEFFQPAWSTIFRFSYVLTFFFLAHYFFFFFFQSGFGCLVYGKTQIITCLAVKNSLFLAGH